MTHVTPLAKNLLAMAYSCQSEYAGPSARFNVRSVKRGNLSSEKFVHCTWYVSHSNKGSGNRQVHLNHVLENMGEWSPLKKGYGKTPISHSCPSNLHQCGCRPQSRSIANDGVLCSEWKLEWACERGDAQEGTASSR